MMSRAPVSAKGSRSELSFLKPVLLPFLFVVPATAIRLADLTIVISAVSDFAFSSYPILILWKVQMKLRTKIGLCCLMGVGVL